MPAEHHAVGAPVHAAEARGIRLLVQALPEGYVVVSNVDLPSGRRGQYYEHDAVVIAPHAVFTVELKSWGGRIVGNRDRWALDDGALVQSPIPLQLAKARALKGQLVARRRDLADAWVEGLVLLSAGDAAPEISADYDHTVITRRELVPALTDPTTLPQSRQLPLRLRREIRKVLLDGREPDRRPTRLVHFQLDQQLAAEDRPYEAWLATAGLTKQRHVLHVYAVTGDSDRERTRVRSLALREATLLGKLQGVPDLLQYQAYFLAPTDPERIVLQFEDTTPLLPLRAWAGQRRAGLTGRLVLGARVARALARVHDKKLVHRRLSSDAVLVSDEDEPAEVRLCALELARDVSGGTLTITGSSLIDPSFRCAAPETLRTGESTPRSDLFSLGATLWELLAGRPLFANADDILKPFDVPAPSADDRPVPAAVTGLLRRLLDPSPEARPADADLVAAELEDAVGRQTSADEDRDLEATDVVLDVYELERRLGRGATATTWLARHTQTGGLHVLKVAELADAERLQAEARILDAVRHDHLVRYYNVSPHGERTVLVLEHVDGVTAGLWAVAGDSLDAVQIRGVAAGLLGALGALHAAGYVHRDVKPDNVMLADPEARATLIDLGLACRIDEAQELAVGTYRYKDPLVYAQGGWTPANDLYAAFLVLYELLTGTHAFGSASPDSGEPPTIEADLLPDTLDAEATKRLAALFERALSPDPSQRPAAAAEALAAVEEALATVEPKTLALLPQEVTRVSADATPDTLVDELPLATRSAGALARLGILTLRQLAGLDLETARRVPNVGRKTLQELAEVIGELHGRWPDLAPDERRVPPARADRLFPALSGDERPLSELGGALTKAMRAVLAERGIRTVGDLADSSERALAQVPRLGRKKREALLAALRRIAGRDDELETCSALIGKLVAELGEGRFRCLDAVVGLTDGVARTPSDAADHLAVSRQRVGQAVDLERLHAAASAARSLARAAGATLPPVGFASLEDVARALATRLPAGDGGPSPLGCARLSALLIARSPRATDAVHRTLVARPPWTEEAVEAAQSALAAAAGWPPKPRRRVEEAVWDDLDDSQRQALVRRGADAAQLVDALQKLAGGGVAADSAGALYAPPVELADALAHLRPELGQRASASALVEEAARRLEGVVEPEDPAAALRSAGYVLDGDEWIDPDRVETAVAHGEPKLDPVIPRKRLDDRPELVDGLAAAAETGGVRVVAMPPGRHHRLSRRLHGWLAEALGAERVDYVHVDRALVEALQDSGEWEYVPFYEGKDAPDWSWAAGTCEVALDRAVEAAAPGRVTVLAQPSLLGTLELTSWLSGFYERARGGRHGLVVLAIPGGVHDNRVRLNERYSLPYTPDMAAVYLEA